MRAVGLGREQTQNYPSEINFIRRNLSTGGGKVGPWGGRALEETMHPFRDNVSLQSQQQGLTGKHMGWVPLSKPVRSSI